MDANPVVFDVSSDEEPAIEEPKQLDDDFNWLTELLRTVDKEEEDSDEVMVLGEYNPPKPKSKSKSSNQMTSIKLVVDDDDSDCVVLDGDPDKPIAADVSQDKAGSDDGDDVLVVAEKGPIACRDYPHPRHLCVEFPFSFTPHEKHCQLCHCYVCDSLAPCAHWGTGVSTIDHCHATDKQEMWKTQREIYRIGKDAPVPVSKLPVTPILMGAPRLNQVGPVDMLQFTPNTIPQNQVLTCNPIPQDQVSRIPMSSSSTKFGIPNIIRHSRNRQSGCFQDRKKLAPRSVSRPAHGMRTSIQRDRGHSISNLGHPFANSNTMFKRPGIVGCTLTTNYTKHATLSRMTCTPTASRYTSNVAPLAASKESPTMLQYVSPNTNFRSHTFQTSQPNTGSVIAYNVPSRPEVCSDSIPLSNEDQGLNQLENQGQNVPVSDVSDFDFCRVNNLSQIDQGASVENIFHVMVPNMEPSTDKQFSSQFTEIDSAQFHFRDHEFVDSLFLNPAVPRVSEGFVPPDLNVFSPEPSAIETGMLCLDEQFWNDPTHV